MTRFFPKNFPQATASKLQNTTIRNFGGGLNAVDSDMNMDPRFQVTLRNARRTAGGSSRIRFGSQWFADVKSVVTGDIVDMEYFNTVIIVVTSTGQVAKVDGDGVPVVIFNTLIAALLPGAPAAWGATTQVDFVPFGAQLILHNGTDKPLTIDDSYVVEYLTDLATGSNVNTPIGKYGCVVQNYHCIGGIPAAPTEIYISSIGTAGTFPNDPIPNDSINIDVGAYAPEGAQEIRAIAGFRAYLLVFFLKQTLVVKLGTYNDAGDHIPEFPDSIPSFGIIGHRCVTQIENDLLFVGLNGLNSAQRNVFSSNIQSTTLSDIIEPAIRIEIGTLTDTQLKLNSFTVYDSLHHETHIELPTGTNFVYSSNEKLKFKSWSTDTGIEWTSACVSYLGRVFGSDGTRIFQQGNHVYDDEHYYADRLNDRLNDWVVNTTYFVDNIIRDTVTEESYICIEQHISGIGTFADDRAAQIGSPKWELYLGEPIHYYLEAPWLDSNDPMRIKFNRYISIVTTGTASYTVKAYVDGLFKDEDGNIIFDPALEMNFVGDNAAGFGYQSGLTQPFGGGRRGGDPRLWKFPVKFKRLKIIFESLAYEALEIGAVSFVFARGGYKR